MTGPLRLGIVGCGAVTEGGHLPATRAVPGVDVTALVDRNLARAQALAAEWKVPHVFADVAECFEAIDAAILAVPHHLHAPLGLALLEQGKHLLIEKPLALNTGECDALIGAAEKSGAIVAVGLMRRFQRCAVATKRLLEAGTLGKILRFEAEDGGVYGWPVASDFFFKKETAGGGVLMDTGAHTLDTLLWWFGEPSDFTYYDDAHGGVEADCLLELTLPGGGSGTVRLSRTAAMSCAYRIIGEKGELRVPIHINEMELALTRDGVRLDIDAQTLTGHDQQQYADLMVAQLEDWAEAIRGGHAPRVSAREARRSVALIEACYARRQDWNLPWLQPA